jgi:hypothetical protein
MKVRSAHIKFERNVKYKDLAPIFKEMYTRFLDKSGQMPEDEEVLDMLVFENMLDLERNRKPEGFNRQGKMRMIFPILQNGVEFYVYKHYNASKTNDVVKVAESLSSYLNQKGFKHQVDWDQMEVHKMRK